MVKIVRVIRKTSLNKDDEIVALDGTANDERGISVAERVIYIIGGVIIGLLALRFILALLGANRASGFSELTNDLSEPFASPFFGLFNYNVQYGLNRFEFEILVAIIVWGILAMLIAKLAAINRPAVKYT